MFTNHAGSTYTKILLAGGLVAIGLLLTACQAPDRSVRTTTALRAYGQGELAVGDSWRDFAFTLADERVSRLSAQRGRVTVLAFPDDPDWPNCEQTRALADLANDARNWAVNIVVVSVGQPDAACAEALEAGRTCGIQAPHVLLVCDPHGNVRNLYGSEAAGRYYLLSNFLEVKAIGDLHDLNTLETEAAHLAREIYDQDDREGKYDGYGSDHE